MTGTLLNLKTLITEEVKAMSMEGIAEQYKITQDPRLFAVAFERLHRIALKAWLGKYTMLDESDVESWTLEQVDVALMTYSPGTAKVSTYFQTLIYNKFRTEAQNINRDKRRVVFESSSYDYLVEGGFDVPGKDLEIEDIDIILQGYDLSERESAYCVMAAQGYDNKMIAEQLKVTAMSVSNIRKRLRNKFSDTALSF